MPRPELLGRVIVLAMLSLAGCTKPVTVRAPIMLPAQLPIRTYPSVWIVGGHLPEADLGARLMAHLGSDPGREVRRLEVNELEPLHEAGRISPLTLVVVLEPGMESGVHERFDMVPVQYCDFYWGCTTTFQRVYSATPEVVGEVLITVYEGPTARVLQTLRLSAAVYEVDTPAARAKVLQQLSIALERAVDVIKSAVEVQLEPVEELPLVGEAIARIRAGKWEEGRNILETVAKQLGGQKHGVQARVWYDLGIARWYAAGPGGLSQAAHDAAARALKLAIATDRSSRYRRALDALERARARQQILEEQRRAAAHNFALRVDSPAAP